MPDEMKKSSVWFRADLRIRIQKDAGSLETRRAIMLAVQEALDKRFPGDVKGVSVFVEDDPSHILVNHVTHEQPRIPLSSPTERNPSL